MSELYRDFIDGKADEIINSLGGTITPAPANVELYRNFLDRKFDDVITALNGSITPAPISDELYRDFIERKFDDVISGIGSYIPPVSFPTVSGSICTFNTALAMPLKSCVVDFQDGTGIDSLDFTATGFNLLSSATLRTNIYISQKTGEEIAYNNWSATGFLPMKPDVRYRLLGLVDGNYSIIAGGSIYWACYDSEYNYILGGIGDGMKYDSNKVAYMRISSFTNILSNKGVIVADENKDYFVTESDYIDGNGKIFNFGKTIQNGSLNVLTGELTNNDTTPPEVINLGGMEIDTLQGVNNIWAVTGDTTLQYIKLGGNT